MPERKKFLEEMSIVAEAVSKAFGAEKMNYELLGMGDAHLHWHLYPRRNGDIENYGNNGKGPVWQPPVGYWAERNEGKIADGTGKAAAVKFP